MIFLTDSQQQALSKEDARPAVVVNPSTNEQFALVPFSEYEKLLALLADENERFAEEMAPLMWEVMEADWKDPALDAYERLVAKKP